MLFLVIILNVFLIQNVSGLQLNFGQCPLIYDEPCKKDTIKFILFGKGNGKMFSQELNPFRPYIPASFNLSSEVKIVIHGYGGLSIDTASTNVTEAYQKQGYNVIEVDWSSLAKTPCYMTAFVNTWHVGQCVAILAVSLAALGVAPGQLHLIGFSLGAHIASFASNNLKLVLGAKVSRITGLDPALPLFATVNNDWKLDKTDANFVDVIHTNAGTFGKLEASGHIDFYVNGGHLQPVCYDAQYPPLCSHLTAGLYFAESIVSKNFIGIECSSLLYFLFGICDKYNSKAVVMGEHCDIRARGKYFLNTDTKPPFALGEKGLLRLL